MPVKDLLSTSNTTACKIPFTPTLNPRTTYPEAQKYLAGENPATANLARCKTGFIIYITFTIELPSRETETELAQIMQNLA